MFQRMGLYPPPPGASPIPGLEVSGSIVATGEGVDEQLHIGRSVCALLSGGGYAEYCVADVSLCLPVPEGKRLVRSSRYSSTKI
jgi:NADPH:quinone reductase-like Zn-dependent oxidoreductase